MQGRSDWLGDLDGPWPRIVTFAFPLRDPLPVGDGSTITRLLPGEVPELAGRQLMVMRGGPVLPADATGSMFVSLRIRQMPARPGSADLELLDGAMEVLGVGRADRRGDEEEQPGYHSIVEAVTVVRRQDVTGPGEGLGPVSRCLDTLFEMVRAYRLAEDVRISELTYERVLPLVPYVWRTLDDPAPSETHLLMLEHANVRTPSPEIWGADDVGRYMLYLERLIKGDPFLLYAERRLEAMLALYQQGQYAESSIQGAIAAEVLLDGVLSMLLWEEALPHGEVETGAAAFSTDTAKRVRSQYHPRLGGQWSLDGDHPVARWYAITAGLRNRVVHRGYRPTKPESIDALEALFGLEAYVCDRLARESRRYPRTALALLGASGLQRRGLWSDARFGDQAIGSINDLIPQYVAWRRTLDEVVSLRRRRG